MTRDRGFALLIVLWALVPLSLLFTIMASAARSDAQLAGNLRQVAAAEAEADGAIYTAIFALMGGGAPAEAEITGLSGLVNPNLAPPAFIAALLVRLGAEPREAESLAAAVLDWRTPGQRPSPHGAKAAEYQAAGLSYGPPGAPFETLDELREVKGMTPGLWAALRPHLTLFTDGDPDPAAADPLVRGALRDMGLTRGGAVARVVRITASAGRAGIAVTRSAVVRMAPTNSGRGWRVLSWKSGIGRTKEGWNEE